jgi:HEAT repeats
MVLRKRTAKNKQQNPSQQSQSESDRGTRGRGRGQADERSPVPPNPIFVRGPKPPRFKDVVLNEKNQNSEWQKQLIFLLGQNGDESALAELCKILENNPDPEVRAAAAHAIGVIAEEESQSDAD